MSRIPGAPDSSSSSASYVIGRAREQALLGAHLSAALSGRGSLVLVAGEAGIGKTTLVQALERDATAQGALVLTGHCYDLITTPPYGPWIDLFSSYRPEGDLPPLPSVVTDRRQISQLASQEALFAQVCDFLVRLSRRRTLVLILEDLHWTDAASLEFLRYLARQIADLSLLLVVTYRDTELDRGHPLYQVLPVLVREANAARINLRRLDEASMLTLVEDRYHLTTLEVARLVEQLSMYTEGNPFYIVELLRTLEEEGYIRPTDDGWELGDLGQVPVPPLVRQVIEGRLARIDEESRALLSLAAIIGQEIPIDLWRAASGASDEELTRVIEQAIGLHLLEELADRTGLRFTHALVREALYDRVVLPRRRLWHRTVGEALASQPAPDPDAVAYHFHEAQHEQAVEWLMRAGERAQHLYAWRTAAERFEALMHFVETDPQRAGERGWLLYRIGLLLRYSDPERGVDYLREAEQAAAGRGDQQLAAYAKADRGLLRCLIGDIRRGLDEMTAGMTALDELPAIDTTDASAVAEDAGLLLTAERIRRGALDLIGTSMETNTRQGALVLWLAWTGHYSEAVTMGEPYVARAANAIGAIQDACGDALAGLGHAYAGLGRPSEALQFFAQAREVYGSIDHHFKVGNTAIYELSESLLPYQADRLIEREWLAAEAEAG